MAGMFDGLQYMTFFDVTSNAWKFTSVEVFMEITAKSEILQSTRVRPVTRFSMEHTISSSGVKELQCADDFQYAIRSFFFLEDFPSFFCVLRGTQRTLTGVQTLVPRYWPGYPWYHGIRATLGQHCTAECRLALRDVHAPKAIGTFFVAVDCDWSFLLSVELLSCLVLLLAEK